MGHVLHIAPLYCGFSTTRPFAIFMQSHTLEADRQHSSKPLCTSIVTFTLNVSNLMLASRYIRYDKRMFILRPDLGGCVCRLVFAC